MSKRMSKHLTWSACLRTVVFVLGSGAAMTTAFHAKAGAYNGGFTATMNQGSVDTYGYFGPAGTDYSGRTITGTFSYDPAALADGHCHQTFPAEGCWSGAVTISETIAGAGTVTFHGTAPGRASGLNIWTGLPAATSNTDQYTLTSVDEKGPVNATVTDGTTLGFWSKVSDFLTDPTDNAPAFSLTNAQLAPGSYGSIGLSSQGAEVLGFQFIGPSDQAQGAPGGNVQTNTPEPGSLMLLLTGVAAAAAGRRRCFRFRRGVC